MLKNLVAADREGSLAAGVQTSLVGSVRATAFMIADVTARLWLLIDGILMHTTCVREEVAGR